MQRAIRQCPLKIGKLEDSSPQLHLKASGDSQFSQKKCNETTSRGEHLISILNSNYFFKLKQEKRLCMAFLAKAIFFCGCSKAHQKCVALEDFEASFLVAISRATPDLHHGRDRVTSPTRSSIQVTLRLNVWGDACGGYGEGR